MSTNEQPNNLPIELLLEEKKKIVVFNSEHENILEQIKKELEADRYNSIVTIDSFDDMTDSYNELGKTSKLISRFRIDKKDSEMEDINLFDKNFKSYCTLIDEKQETIKQGLSVFEELKRKQILEVCTKYLVEQYKEKDLRVEFRIIDIKDMTLSKYVTEKMNISKPGKDEIDKRINEKLALQNKVDNRILSLENTCLKAGIEPLTIEHIQGFLFEADDKYEIKLKLLIDAEVKRSEVAKQKNEAEIRKQIAEEKIPFENVEEVAQEQVKEVAREVEQPIKKEVPVVAGDGKILRTVSMQVTVKPTVPDELVLKHIFGLIGNDVNKFIEMFKVS